MPSDTSRLIDKIRDAGLAPDAWPEALKSLTDALGVTGAACIIFNRRTGNVDWVCFSGLSAEFQSTYINHYAPLDPLSPMLIEPLRWTKLSECLPVTALQGLTTTRSFNGYFEGQYGGQFQGFPLLVPLALALATPERTLNHHAALELGKHAHHLKHRLAGRREWLPLPSSRRLSCLPFSWG